MSSVYSSVNFKILFIFYMTTGTIVRYSHTPHTHAHPAPVACSQEQTWLRVGLDLGSGVWMVCSLLWDPDWNKYSLSSPSIGPPFLLGAVILYHLTWAIMEFMMYWWSTMIHWDQSVLEKSALHADNCCRKWSQFDLWSFCFYMKTKPKPDSQTRENKYIYVNKK